MAQATGVAQEVEMNMTDCWTSKEWIIGRGSWFRRQVGDTVKHNPGCQGPRVDDEDNVDQCGGVYRCGRCGELCGWCRGGHEGDERNDYCDACSNAVSCPHCDLILRYKGIPNEFGYCENRCQEKGQKQ